MSVLTSLFFIGGPGYHSCRSLKAAWNLGHIMYFALLPIFIFSFSLGNKIKHTNKVVIIVAITMIFGVFIEIFQNSLNRTLDLGDLYRNMLGASVAILFFLPNRGFIPRTRLIALRTICITLVMIQFVPIGIALIDEQQARRDYPVLSDFQTPFQISRWNGNEVTGVVNTPDKPANNALNVALTTAKYSGVSLKYFQEQWEGYAGFQFNIFNPSTKPLTLTCRIHDNIHNNNYNDRFNKSYIITHGWNSIHINLKEVREAPTHRQMDLHHIRSVGIFATQLQNPRNILIDDVKLY